MCHMGEIYAHDAKMEVHPFFLVMPFFKLFVNEIALKEIMVVMFIGLSNLGRMLETMLGEITQSLSSIAIWQALLDLS